MSREVWKAPTMGLIVVASVRVPYLRGREQRGRTSSPTIIWGVDPVLLGAIDPPEVVLTIGPVASRSQALHDPAPRAPRPRPARPWPRDCPDLAQVRVHSAQACSVSETITSPASFQRISPTRNTNQPKLCNSGRVSRQATGRFCRDQAAKSGLHGNVGPRRPRSGTYLSVENCVFPQTTGI